MAASFKVAHGHTHVRRSPTDEPTKTGERRESVKSVEYGENQQRPERTQTETPVKIGENPFRGCILDFAPACWALGMLIYGAAGKSEHAKCLFRSPWSGGGRPSSASPCRRRSRRSSGLRPVSVVKRRMFLAEPFAFLLNGGVPGVTFSRHIVSNKSCAHRGRG